MSFLLTTNWPIRTHAISISSPLPCFQQISKLRLNNTGKASNKVSRQVCKNTVNRKQGLSSFHNKHPLTATAALNCSRHLWRVTNPLRNRHENWQEQQLWVAERCALAGIWKSRTAARNRSFLLMEMSFSQSSRCGPELQKSPGPRVTNRTSTIPTVTSKGIRCWTTAAWTLH